MKKLRTFKIWMISLLVFSSLITACTSGDSAENHFNQGVTNYEAGNLEQAIADYTKALELDPGFVPAYYNRGLALANSGELEQAIRDFGRYLDLVPNASNREEVINAIEQLKSE